MFRLLSSLIALILLTAVSAWSGEAQLEDMTIRYVNSDVLTLWDLRQRVDQRKEEYRRSGQPLPSASKDWIVFAQECLEDLTDDQLLIQRAKELGMQVNHEAIVLRVLEQAKKEGDLSLRRQAFQRRYLEQREFMRNLVGAIGGLMANPTPTELRARYEAGKAAYDRPARAKVLQLSLRVAGDAQRNELKKAKADLLRKAQDATSPLVRPLVEQALNAYVTATADEQGAVLDRLCKELAALTPKAAELPLDDRAVVDLARRLTEATARLLDRESISDRLETMRLALAGLAGPGLVQAFQEAKRGLGLAVGDDDKGLWVEPGATRLDEVIFALQSGETSQVVWVADSAWLLAVVEREDARQRTFDEVSGELEQQIQYERQQVLRKQLITSLRNRASIHDVDHRLPGPDGRTKVMNLTSLLEESLR